MITFWVSVIILTMIALVFTLAPLLFSKKRNIDSSLQQLPLHDQSAKQFKPAIMTAILLAIVVPLAAIYLYFYWGNHREVAQWLAMKQRAERVKAEISKLGSRQKIIAALHDRLQQMPRDIKSARGWYILGKLYLGNQQLSEALSSFKIAQELDENNPEYMLQYANVKFFANKNLLDNESKKLIQKILQLAPNNVNALNLLALDAYYHKDYSPAIRYWETILTFFPPDSQDSQTILAMIREAQGALKVATSQQSKINQIKFVVSVSLVPQFKHKISDDDAVFIYALEEQGSKMPLAVVRDRAVNLPLTVTLDDSKAMVMSHNLSNAKKIYIEARISKSGNAIPMSGDLIGKSPIMLVTKKQKNILVIIDKVVP
jgi:cytochrome c-type biogenesis protein CcmH